MQVGEIAATATRHQDFLAYPVRSFQDGHATAAVAGNDRAHETGGAAADDKHIRFRHWRGSVVVGLQNIACMAGLFRGVPQLLGELGAFGLCDQNARALRIGPMSPTRAEDLFRRQAIEALSRRPYGRPISLVPKPWQWVTVLIVCIAVAASAFAAKAEYARKESVRGWLVSQAGVAHIRHETAGTVDQILRAPGDHVTAGEPIMVLSRERFLEDGSNMVDVVLAELAKQISTLETRTQLLRQEAELERDAISVQQHGLDRERRALQQQRREQQSRIDAASNKLAGLSAAAQSGAVSDWDLIRQRDDLLAMTQVMSQLEQGETALERQRQHLEAQSLRLPVETERSVVALRSQQSQLQQQVAELKSGHHIVLKAPISGRLASVEVGVGTAVAPRQLLATILPEDLELLAEVYVPSSAIGFVRPGQKVRLMYDAFPYQQFGTFAGKVEYISEAVLLPAEIPQTFFLREAAFRVRIAIVNDGVDLDGGRATLRPGMLLIAEIILENRRFADWLLEPLRLRRRVAA